MGHPTCHVNVIKLNERLYGQAGYLTSPTYGPPPSCKQALILMKVFGSVRKRS